MINGRFSGATSREGTAMKRNVNGSIYSRAGEASHGRLVPIALRVRGWKKGGKTLDARICM